MEVGSREPPYFPDLNIKLGLSKVELIAPEKTKRFIISFHLSSGTMDLLLKSNPNGKKDTSNWDDPKVVIKKTKVPRNWKEAQQNSSKLGGYYEAQHLRSGQTVCSAVSLMEMPTVSDHRFYSGGSLWSNFSPAELRYLDSALLRGRAWNCPTRRRAYFRRRGSEGCLSFYRSE